MYLQIIYQDDDLVAVNKPAGLLTHQDEASAAGFDVVSLLERQTGLNGLGVHQRLDREVSGVLVFAARSSANPGLARVFEGRQAEKEYLALVKGRLPRRAGTIDTPLIEAADGRWRTARAGEKGSKSALTSYRVEQTGPGGSYSLVRLRLDTGRTHQLRVHLAAVGCPIIGDSWYGSADKLSQPAASSVTGRSSRPAPAPSSQALFPRLMLHAVRLTFVPPGQTKPLALQASPSALFSKAASGLPLAELELAERLTESSLAQLRTGDRAGLAGLLSLAAERRLPLSADPTRQTTAYRLVNGAGDGLAGITLDCYDQALVLNCYDPTLEIDHPALRLLLEEIGKLWPARSVYAKFRPRQSSNLAHPGGQPNLKLAPEIPLLGQPLPQVTIQENGLHYLIQPGDGLSPGLFLDMRELRARLAGWAAGKTVLNCFSFTGGFGLVATANGAGRVLNLDAGRRVLDWSKQNYLANNLTPDDYDFVEGDVFDWLGRFARRGQHFGLVILDPPSYSTVKKSRWSAEKDYARLAGQAASVVEPGGLLIACTNHAGLPRRSFRQMVLKGIEDAGRSAHAIGFYDEPDLDFPHPAQTEGYLKLLVLRLD